MIDLARPFQVVIQSTADFVQNIISEPNHEEGQKLKMR